MVALKRAGFSIKTIRTFTNRHVDTIKMWLERIGAGLSPEDHQNSGRHRIFGEDIQLKITAFFCQMKPLPGCSTLSLRWAERYFRGLSDTVIEGVKISRASISRILRKHSLRLHLHKYYLQIMDPDFFPKMAKVIKLYLNPPQYFFSFDECPGIQALRKVAPSLGVAKDHKRYSEPNYNRMGTADVYAFLEISTGKVFGKCTDNHTVETLIEVFTEHVALQRSQSASNATLHYLCDNLSNHSCHEFCETVAKLCNVTYPQKTLDSKAKRQEWLGG